MADIWCGGHAVRPDRGLSQINPWVCLAVSGGFCAATVVAGAYLFRKIT
jgi:hypothetical protein